MPTVILTSTVLMWLRFKVKRKNVQVPAQLHHCLVHSLLLSSNITDTSHCALIFFMFRDSHSSILHRRKYIFVLPLKSLTDPSAVSWSNCNKFLDFMRLVVSKSMSSVVTVSSSACNKTFCRLVLTPLRPTTTLISWKDPSRLSKLTVER